MGHKKFAVSIMQLLTIKLCHHAARGDKYSELLFVFRPRGKGVTELNNKKQRNLKARMN